MPLYVYRCDACANKCNVFKKLSELNRLEPCRFCSTPEPMSRQVVAPMVVADYPGYDCPITGKWIEGRKAHEANLKLHNCRVVEAGETEMFKRRREDEEAKLDAGIESSIEQWITEAPPEKREALAKAEEMGLTASVSMSTVKGPTIHQDLAKA